MLDRPFVKVIAYTVALIVLILVTHEAIMPLERALFAPYLGPGILFYLPLGFWVLVSYYERWLAACYLAPGLAVGLALYGHPDASILMKAAQIMVMAGTAPAVFAGLSWATGRPNEPIEDPFAWRLIVMVGGITAIVNAIGLSLVRHIHLPDVVSVAAVVKFSAGGFIGLVSCLVFLAIAFRLAGQSLFKPERAR